MQAIPHTNQEQKCMGQTTEEMVSILASTAAKHLTTFVGSLELEQAPYSVILFGIRFFIVLQPSSLPNNSWRLSDYQFHRRTAYYDGIMPSRLWIARFSR